MTESVLLRVCRAQTGLVETLIEPWLRAQDALARANSRLEAAEREGKTATSK